MTFKVKWNKKGGESLMDFKDRYHRFKNHVTSLQLKGHLPAGEIYWVVERHEQVELPVDDTLPVIDVGLRLL
jgi:hypothetical protein